MAKVGDITPAQPLLFWIVTVAATVTVVVLLREILLPFVAGMVLAYALDPLVNRLERIGVNRAVAAFAIIGMFIGAVIALGILAVPIIGAELAAFIDRLPGHVSQLKTFATDPSRPWLRKIVGEGLSEIDRSSGELAGFGVGLLRSMWSRGRALLSLSSLLVVTPVVTFYLILGWKRLVRAVDDTLPAEHRATVRALASEIDATLRPLYFGGPLSIFTYRGGGSDMQSCATFLIGSSGRVPRVPYEHGDPASASKRASRCCVALAAVAACRATVIWAWRSTSARCAA
jgi:predicted PurR-regulated permease PerM